MAEIKSESVADFIPESPADFPRNMHKAGRARRRKMVGARHCELVPAPADRRSGRPHARLFSG